MTHKLNRDQSTVIAPDIKWLPIDELAPRGVRMLLIDKSQGIAYIRQHTKGDQFTHWFPLPSMEKGN